MSIVSLRSLYWRGIREPTARSAASRPTSVWQQKVKSGRSIDCHFRKMTWPWNARGCSGLRQWAQKGEWSSWKQQDHPSEAESRPTGHGIHRFITAFTRARRLNPIYSYILIPYLFMTNFNITLPPVPDLWSNLVVSGLKTKFFCAFLISPMHDTCPAHLLLLDFITIMHTFFLFSLLCYPVYNELHRAQSSLKMWQYLSHYGTWQFIGPFRTPSFRVVS
jgi:hypothetical protein